mgnify:CR=1 FL=1
MVYQSVITDIKNIINAGQQEAYGAGSKAMVLTYWNVGKRIVEQEQAGKEHAEYGKKLLVALSDELTKEYGNGYSERNAGRRSAGRIHSHILQWRARSPSR